MFDLLVVLALLVNTGVVLWIAAKGQHVEIHLPPHAAQAVADAAPKERPSILPPDQTLLLMDGKYIRHEVTLHAIAPPDTYEYAGRTYYRREPAQTPRTHKYRLTS